MFEKQIFAIRRKRLKSQRMLRFPGKLFFKRVKCYPNILQPHLVNSAKCHQDMGLHQVDKGQLYDL